MNRKKLKQIKYQLSTYNCNTTKKKTDLPTDNVCANICNLKWSAHENCHKNRNITILSPYTWCYMWAETRHRE